MPDIDRAALKAASEASGVHIETLRSRLKRGMSLDDAVKVESGPYVGVTAASRRTKIPVTTLVSRINAGKTLREAVEMGQPGATSVSDKTVKIRRSRGDLSVRPINARNKGVKEVADRVGLSESRVSELMRQGVAPDAIARMRAKQETARERRERIDAANQKQWSEMAQRQQAEANYNWCGAFLCLLDGLFGAASELSEQARSYERTATWWADKAIGQWCDVCEKKHPPPMHHRGDQRT